MRFSFLRPDQYLDEGEFIRNNEAQYSLEETWNEKEEDGFDIYIDAVHNLPDNCAIVKVKAQVVNNRAKPLLREVDFFPKIDVSTAQTQVYNEKLELRNQKTDPTSLL